MINLKVTNDICAEVMNANLRKPHDSEPMDSLIYDAGLDDSGQVELSDLLIEVLQNITEIMDEVERVFGEDSAEEVMTLVVAKLCPDMILSQGIL